jgi:hypothetical protein
VARVIASIGPLSGRPADVAIDIDHLISPEERLRVAMAIQ